ncbi:MAG: chorismate-binding protein, partial [Thiotrichaceae bacterium]|nr:chorismate-binding protein [Thiotrichaceae bacterium]
HRGWYTGAFGWIDANMNGDLSVMLRCALIDTGKQEINLFSGAGLVAESDPDAEWQETELKMQTIIEML